MANTVFLIQAISRKKKGQMVQILTHCNAAGSAVWIGDSDLADLSSSSKGIPVHVWVDEPGRGTRARA